MSTFKTKNKKPFISDNRITLDAKHNEIIKQFDSQYKILPEKAKDLANFRKKYYKLNKIPNKNLTNDQLNEKFYLAESITNIENEIKKIEEGEEEFDYFLNTGHLLYKYYDNIQTIATNKKNYDDELEDTPKNIIESVKIESVVDFFTSKPNQLNVSTLTPTSKTISDYVTMKENFQRADILDDYLKIVDPSYVGTVCFDCAYDKCSVCDCEKTLVQSEGIMVCENCGHTDYVVIDSDRPSYKDPQRGMKSALLLLYRYTIEKPVNLLFMLRYALVLILY
jgi:hypothetical protein